MVKRNTSNRIGLQPRKWMNSPIPSAFALILLLFISPLFLQAQYTTTVVITTDGAQTSEGLLAPSIVGQEPVEGSMTVLVGQALISPVTLTGSSQEMDLGFYSQMLRQPAQADLTASYDHFPNRIDLIWDYDPNDPPSSGTHDIFRDDVLIRNEYSDLPDSYTDMDPSLNVGQSYTYRIEGRNSYGMGPFPAEAVGKTSTSASISGWVKTPAPNNTPIPNTRLRLTPNWGHSLFLNGSDQYVTIPDADQFELASTLLPAATLEFWFNPDQVADQVLVGKGTAWELGLASVGGYAKLTFKVNQQLVWQSDENIPTSDWTHLALVKSGQTGNAATYRLYLDGDIALNNADQDSVVLSQVDAGNESLVLGASSSGSQFFRGRQDEVRFWSTARTAEQIQLHWESMVYPYTQGQVNHADLTAIYKMDETSGALLVNPLDQTLNGTLLNPGADNWSETIAPAWAQTYTDADGHYSINNIYFDTDHGTTFRLSPLKAYHEFNPIYRDVTLSINNMSANDVDFQVTNLMTITGRVTYNTANTGGVLCGAEGVKILVNDEDRGIRTDANGQYSIAVEPGADVVITPDLASRTTDDYLPMSISFTDVFTDKIADFVDRKTRELIVNVNGGACQVPLGGSGFAWVHLDQASGCFSLRQEVNADGVVSFEIPPADYQVSVEVELGTSYRDAVRAYFESAGQSINMENSYSMSEGAWVTEFDELEFNYRAPLELSVQGFPENELEHKQFEQNIADTLTLFAYEIYGEGAQADTCPSAAGNFKVLDLISDRPDTTIIPWGETGIGSYILLPGQPNLSEAVIDGIPHGKTIEISADDQRTVESMTARAVVLGHKPQQVDFATTAPAIPLLILRRPPGDGSVASFSSTEAQCTEMELSVGSYLSVGNELTLKMGLGTSVSAGFLVNTEVDVAVINDLTLGLSATMSQTSSQSQSICVSCETSYSTGLVEEYLGYRGDVFVGGAMNLLYGETKVLDLVQGEYDIHSEIIFVPNGFATTFAYTHGYIEDVLIPELTVLALEDTTLNASIRRWNNILARENALRWATTDNTNITFSASADYESSRTTDVTSSFRHEFSLDLDAELVQTVGFVVNDQTGFENTRRVGFGMHVGSVSSGSQSQSNTSSFLLSDDDAGDSYTVSIGSDPAYGTPVFKVLAGTSSCPYEAWYNQDGALVTSPQDHPHMEWVNGGTRTNVLPGEAAILPLLLRNDNQTEERTYYLSQVASSNPSGAIIRFGGSSGPIDVTLGPNSSTQLEVSVLRGPGETYEYENLELKFAPECEANYAGVTEGFNLPFTVKFAEPCTDASFVSPGEDWILNISSSNSLPITVTGYDLDQEIWDALELQYKPDGGETWFQVESLDSAPLQNGESTSVSTVWDVSSLSDGEYDLRLRSICLQGSHTNEMTPLRGIIDRDPPGMLGSSEPIDGVLNLNDEIAVNLDEPIDPSSLEVSEVLVSDLTLGQGIGNFEIDVTTDRIVVIPLGSNASIENHSLRVSIAGYEDLQGNLGEPLVWEFTVNRNPITWNSSSLEQVAIIGEENDFVVRLNNIGSAARPFELTGFPSWLSAHPLIGEINPGGAFDIHFSVDPNVNVGEYSATIRAETPDGDEPFQVDLTAMCPYPDWSFTPTDYQYSMSVTARVHIQGTACEDAYDRIGAFIGGEPRGFANIEYNEILNEHLAFLTIYSNEYSGESIELHVWDRTGCAEFWEVDTTLAFGGDAIVGTPTAPIDLNANGALGQELSLSSGFTWFSLNLNGSASSDLDAMFQNVPVSDGDRIIGQAGFAQYSSSQGSWLGPLASTGLELGKMYFTDLDTADVLDFIGFPVNPDATDLTIYTGWNWLGYLPRENFSTSHALTSLNSSDNDLIKDQFSFAQYIDGYGWFGSLQYMRPGYGYKLLSGSGDTLTYPAENIQDRQVPELEINNDRITNLPFTAPHDFAQNMTATLLLEEPVEGLELLAFVGDDLRGWAAPVFIPAMEEHRVFMVIYGESGETVRFEIHEAGSDVVYQSNEIMIFMPDEVMGTPLEPMLITRAPLGVGDTGYVPDSYSLGQNYPNPFNPHTKIGFGIPKNARVSVKIYNLRGQVVKTLVNDDLDAGYRFVVWNSKDEVGSSMTSGVYFVVMESAEFREVRKMLLLK